MTHSPSRGRKARSASEAAVDQRLARRIHTLRLAAGFSLVELAEKLGVTYQQVQKYEQGANQVSASRLVSIADALGVSMTSFFEILPDDAKLDGSTQAAAEKLKASRDLDSLTRAFAQIENPKMRQALVTIAHGMSSLDEEAAVGSDGTAPT